jgi:amino acid transporter
MHWIENIRQKPQADRVRIIFMVCGAVAVIMIILWIVIGGLKTDDKKDLRLFKSIGDSFKDASGKIKSIPDQPRPY